MVRISYLQQARTHTRTHTPKHTQKEINPEHADSRDFDVLQIAVTQFHTSKKH